MDTKTIAFNVNKKTNKPPIKEDKKIDVKEDKKKDRKRVEAENWTFSSDIYEHSNQMKIIRDIQNNKYNHIDEVSKIALQQVNRKIYGYKQQDMIKKLFDERNFIHIMSIIDKMLECELKCYYCKIEMNVLYDIAREMKQWTVDRIDNDLGHNLDNYYLACLECNLKRRRRSDDKFLFTKQLKLVKIEDTSGNENQNGLYKEL